MLDTAHDFVKTAPLRFDSDQKLRLVFLATGICTLRIIDIESCIAAVKSGVRHRNHPSPVPRYYPPDKQPSRKHWIHDGYCKELADPGSELSWSSIPMASRSARVLSRAVSQSPKAEQAGLCNYGALRLWLLLLPPMRRSCLLSDTTSGNQKTIGMG